MDREFWANESLWPRDHGDYVFLARAVQMLGAAIHQHEWTGREIATPISPVLPVLISHNNSERMMARQLLSEDRPDIELSPLSPAVKGIPPRRVSISQEQWDIAREISRKRFEAVKPVFQRLHRVFREIEAKAAAGELRTFYRSLAGGGVSPVPAIWWNTERTTQRWYYCKLNPHDPFSIAVAGDKFAWIFVERTDLENLCSSHGAQMQTFISGQDHLSPYMRLMIQVAKQLNITPDNQPKKDVVMAALRAAWPKPIARSEKLLETMATILREPDSQLGRAKKKLG